VEDAVDALQREAARPSGSRTSPSTTARRVRRAQPLQVASTPVARQVVEHDDALSL
jgi:hypothetical protein